MKKSLLLVVGMLACGYASAVQFAASGPLKDTDCALLNESVTINLSKNVVAGVGCNAKAIALTACHTGGRTTTRNAPVCKDTDGDAATGVAGKEDCSAPPSQVSGAQMASATTQAGTVTPQYPGEVCSATIAESQATNNLPTAP